MADLPPRVLIVSRRTVRKNKFVDFVGEYHLDLIVEHGAVPVIVPRVSGIENLLNSFEPIHGVLLCEGEDIDPSHYETQNTPTLSPDKLEEIKKKHAGDTAIDKEKDSIELKLAKLCLEQNMPCLGICRGSQVLNVACGGTLYRDVTTEIAQSNVVHMNYENYDGHRHAVKLVECSPLHDWFKESMDKKTLEISVNSYHHQGIKHLAKRFVPMAFAHDGLIEGFYDPEVYNPGEGKFLVGLQFHPERMKLQKSEEFEYPGCAAVYKEFVRAVRAYQKKIHTSFSELHLQLNQEIEKKRKIIAPSFLLRPETKFLEFNKSNATLSFQEEVRLTQMGATVRNSSFYMDKLKSNKEKNDVLKVMGMMSIE